MSCCHQASGFIISLLRVYMVNDSLVTYMVTIHFEISLKIYFVKLMAFVTLTLYPMVDLDVGATCTDDYSKTKPEIKISL